VEISPEIYLRLGLRTLRFWLKLRCVLFRLRLAQLFVRITGWLFIVFLVVGCGQTMPYRDFPMLMNESTVRAAVPIFELTGKLSRQLSGFSIFTGVNAISIFGLPLSPRLVYPGNWVIHRGTHIDERTGNQVLFSLFFGIRAEL
jgi:hypothetical protein